MRTSEHWMSAIENACEAPDPARSNARITALHYLLSEALADRLGREGGPNFHSWAVWGSRKAGVTIRQEDLDSAIHNATVVAGIVGCAVGAVAGIVAGRKLRWANDLPAAALGVGLGALTGGWTGKQIAIWSRAKAAKLILEGNQTVLRDIGEQSARFIELLENGGTREERETFFAGLRPGPTERGGQDLLATAFRSYLSAFDAIDPGVKREAMIAGNCAIVFHEHIRLEPYIRGAMPVVIQRCATQRLMTYDIGEQTLEVGKNIKGVAAPTAARNWVNIDDRMRYVFALFREFHEEPELFSRPADVLLQ